MSQYVARAVADAYERNERANEFFLLARATLAGKGVRYEMRRYADYFGASTRVKNIIEKGTYGATMRKAAVDPLSLGDQGDDLAPYENIAAGYIASLAPWSAFDAIWNTPNAFRKLRARSRAVITTATATGTLVSESMPKPLTTLQVSGEDMEPRKCVSFLVVSDELAANVTPHGTDLLRTESAQAAGLAADLTFLTLLADSTDVQSAGSSGMTPTAFQSDLKSALISLRTDSTSKVFLVAPPIAVMEIALMNYNGLLCHPQMTISGGSIQGVQVIPSNALSDSMVLMDARQIAVDNPAPIFDSAGDATLEFSDNPTSGDTVTRTNLWQDNLKGLRTERWLAAKLLRPTALATITGVSTTA